MACKNSKTKGEFTSTTIIPIDLKNVTTLNYQNQFDSIEYISLETTDHSLIGEIDKLYITDSNIIIFDSKRTDILLFDRVGNFLQKIGKKGRGPEEYLFFNDIFFDPNTNMIYAHERYLNKMFKYNLTGELLKQIESKYHFNSFTKAESGFWIYSCFKTNNPEGYNLMLVDENLQEKKAAFFPQDPAFINALQNTTFIESPDGSQYFIYPTSNIVYQLTKDKPIPYYTIDFGSKNLPFEQIKTISSSEEYEKIVANKRYLETFGRCHFVNNLFLFSFKETGFNIQTQSYRACFNSNTAKIEVFDKEQNFSLLPLSFKPLGTTKKTIIYGTDNWALDYISEEGEKLLKKKKFNNINSLSNSILVLLHLK